LASIARALAGLAPALDAVLRGSDDPGGHGPKLRLSPDRRAALKLQGQYMGYLRSLKPREKARAKALRAKKGVRAAIGLAKRLAQA